MKTLDLLQQYRVSIVIQPVNPADIIAVFQSKQKNSVMKNLSITGLLLLILSISSCQIIGGIFKAGAFVGVLAVVIVIVVLLGIISMFRKK